MSDDEMLADMGLDEPPRGNRDNEEKLVSTSPRASAAPKPAAKGRRAGTSLLGSGTANYGAARQGGGSVGGGGGGGASRSVSATPSASAATGAAPRRVNLDEESDDEDNGPEFSFLSRKSNNDDNNNNNNNNATTNVPSSSPRPVPSSSLRATASASGVRQQAQARAAVGAGTAQAQAQAQAQALLPDQVASLREEVARELETRHNTERQLEQERARQDEERARARELEEKVGVLEVRGVRLTEERKLQDEVLQRVERDRDDLRREADEARKLQQQTAQANHRLQVEADEADGLKRDVKELRERQARLQDDYALERRRAAELQQALADPSVIPYTPPPAALTITKGLPLDAPLTTQLQVMLFNCVSEITGYQKNREEALMQALRAEQQRWQEEMAKREDLRQQVERQEIAKWRQREQEARLERERRDEEDRVLRAQKDEKERQERERSLREERASDAAQGAAERDTWAARVHAEHQQTVERITQGYTAAQEQMARAHEHQVTANAQHAEEERRHLRNIAEQQLADLSKKYESVVAMQEAQHRDTIRSMAQFGDAMQKMTQCHTSLEENLGALKDTKKSWDAAWSAAQQEKQAAMADRETILEEMRRAAAEKAQHLDSERVMLSRLFADFKVTVDNIKQQQDAERSRLTASAKLADKAREDYEREHRRWMRDCLRQQLDTDSAQTDAVTRVVDAVEELKLERQGLHAERREFERAREAHLRSVADADAAAQKRREEAEAVLREAAKKEELVNEAGTSVQAQLLALQQQEQAIAAEKEKLRDELYRVKDLGNMAYQKSKDLQKARDEIRAAAGEVEQRALDEAASRARRLDEERVDIERQKAELVQAKKDILVDAATRRRKALMHEDSLITATAAPSNQPPMRGTVPQHPQQAPAQQQQGGQQVVQMSRQDLHEIFEQQQYLKYNVGYPGDPPRSTDGGDAPRKPAQHADPTGGKGQGPQQQRASPTPAARVGTAPAADSTTMESLVGQQWVSLLRLSEDGYVSDSW